MFTPPFFNNELLLSLKKYNIAPEAWCNSYSAICFDCFDCYGNMDAMLFSFLSSILLFTVSSIVD